MNRKQRNLLKMYRKLNAEVLLLKLLESHRNGRDIPLRQIYDEMVTFLSNIKEEQAKHLPPITLGNGIKIPLSLMMDILRYPGAAKMVSKWH